jgi:hypothetical protein
MHYAPYYPRKRTFSPMIKRRKCPYCVRVTCEHPFRTDGVVPIVWKCLWRGYRPTYGALKKPCPKCNRSDALSTAPVYHRLGHYCIHQHGVRDALNASGEIPR